MCVQGVYLVAGLRFQKSTDHFITALESAFQGGIRLFQLRIKDELSDKEHLELSKKIRALTLKYKVTYLVNDRPDIAFLSDADGLHLGPTDMTVQDARKIVGNRIIGKSSHNYAQVEQACREPIDYLAIGPVYETDSKKEPDPVVGIGLLEQAIKIVRVPTIAIGGIHLNNLKPVLETGVSGFGLIRGIMAAQDIEEESRKYVQSFSNWHSQQEKL